MNKRERILLIAVVAIASVFMGKTIINTVMLGPIRKVDQQILAVKQKIEKKDMQLRSRKRALQEWVNLDIQCISQDPEVGKRLFIERVQALIRASGLQNPIVKPLKVAARKVAGIERYYPIAVNLTADGTLKQITQFLEMFYAEPYLSKITAVSLKPRGKGNILKLSKCRLEAIVLPRVAQVKDQAELQTTSRPALLAKTPKLPSEPSRYAAIYDKNIFTPPQKARTGIIKTTGRSTRPRGKRQEEPNREPPVAKSDGQGSKIVGTVAYGGQKAVYVRNRQGTDLYKLGQQLAGQQIVLVHPLGIILQDSDNNSVYVEIGQNISTAAPLDSSAAPELYRAWQDKN